VLTKSLASNNTTVCMRAAAPRATHGSTLRIERCFANAPVRHEWLSSADTFAAQLNELHARIACFAVAHPRAALSVLGAGDTPLVHFASAHTSIKERIAVAFPAFAPMPTADGRGARPSSTVRVVHVFAAQTLVAHLRAATQLVYLDGAPLSAAHHERLFDAIDGALTHKLAPQSRSATRLHAAFAVFFESSVQGAVVAQHCERITDCAIADAMAAALRIALYSPPPPPRVETIAVQHRSNNSSTVSRGTTPEVVVSYAPVVSRESPQPRQSMSQLYATWMKPRVKSATSSAAAASRTTPTVGGEIQFSRADIGAWRFVAQCDRKYLLLWWPEQQMLIAADQHAVDERINLERLEASVFGDIASVARRSQPLATALEWRVTREQARLLADAVARAATQRWGFRYSWLGDTTLLVTQQPAIESTSLGLDVLLDIAACAAQVGERRPQTVERILHAKVSSQPANTARISRY
jgi:DNA mismatch repair ATPase MutL